MFSSIKLLLAVPVSTMSCPQKPGAAHRLPTDPVLLQRVVRKLAEVLERQNAELTATKARLAERDAELEKLQLFLTALKRLKFGRSPEKQHPDQLTLALEAIEEQIAALAAKSEPATPAAAPEKKPSRRPLPGHLPREERRHEPAGCACPACGGKLHVIGEDVSEVLDYVPAQFKVIRHVRPRFACRACESIHQAPMLSLPIERAGRDQGCWPRCWSPSSAIICRCIGNP